MFGTIKNHMTLQFWFSFCSVVICCHILDSENQRNKNQLWHLARQRMCTQHSTGNICSIEDSCHRAVNNCLASLVGTHHPWQATGKYLLSITLESLHYSINDVDHGYYVTIAVGLVRSRTGHPHFSLGYETSLCHQLPTTSTCSR